MADRSHKEDTRGQARTRSLGYPPTSNCPIGSVSTPFSQLLYRKAHTGRQGMFQRWVLLASRLHKTGDLLHVRRKAILRDNRIQGAQQFRKTLIAVLTAPRTIEPLPMGANVAKLGKSAVSKLQVTLTYHIPPQGTRKGHTGPRLYGLLLKIKEAGHRSKSETLRRNP